MLVLEHTPVYTLGRSAKPEDVKFSLEEGEEGKEGGKEGRGFEVRFKRGTEGMRGGGMIEYSPFPDPPFSFSLPLFLPPSLGLQI